MLLNGCSTLLGSAGSLLGFGGTLAGFATSQLPQRNDLEGVTVNRLALSGLFHPRLTIRVLAQLEGLKWVSEVIALYVSPWRIELQGASSHDGLKKRALKPLSKSR
jgi:hypothetical protein